MWVIITKKIPPDVLKNDTLACKERKKIPEASCEKGQIAESPIGKEGLGKQLKETGRMETSPINTLIHRKKARSRAEKTVQAQ